MGQTCIYIIIGLIIIWLGWNFYNPYKLKVYRFYKPSCYYCQISNKEWQKFKRSNQWSKVNIIDINIDNPKYKQLVKKFSVHAVPTVIAINSKGVRWIYTGDRTAISYKKWVKSLRF